MDEFSFQLKKRASAEAAHAVMEIAGLGMLAAPHLLSQKTRLGQFLHTARGAKTVELLGLGTLAIPSISFLGNKFMGKKPRHA